MSIVQIKNLTFSYDESYEDVFHNISLSFDTSMKIALIGRNGRGKTTLLKLFMGEYEYQGTIVHQQSCAYFPYPISSKENDTLDVCYEIEPMLQKWQLERELRYLDVDPDDLFYRPFSSLSQGEQTKVLLATLFLKEHTYLLIDEPTNHLDQDARQVVANYLKKQKGFLLVSHDRAFIDMCCDHIIAINPTSLEIMSGHFSTWYQEKMNRDQNEWQKNEKIKKEMHRLLQSQRQSASWSYQVEKSKQGAFDKGYVGHKAAKMMKRSKNLEKRQNRYIEEKKELLKDIEEYDDLILKPQHYFHHQLISLQNLSLFYNHKSIFSPLSFEINQGDRILLKGKNGCGKSSLIAFLLGKPIEYQGIVHKGSQLTISYVPQDCSYLQGDLNTLIDQYHVDMTLVITILRKLNFSRLDIQKDLQSLSAGQKKKIMLALSLATPAHLYIWDEPLNYIDIFSRIQIEKLILEYQPTLLFVEHDVAFGQNIASKVINFM